MANTNLEMGDLVNDNMRLMLSTVLVDTGLVVVGYGDDSILKLLHEVTKLEGVLSVALGGFSTIRAEMILVLILPEQLNFPAYQNLLRT
jgi:hypothetical protein